MTTRVEIGLGYTRNLGDFNSLRVDVRVGEDARQGESVKDLENRVYNFVETRLIKRINEIEHEIKLTQAEAREEVKNAIRTARRKNSK
jgi:predicted DNA-binding transcriptional regulator